MYVICVIGNYSETRVLPSLPSYLSCKQIIALSCKHVIAALKTSPLANEARPFRRRLARHSYRLAGLRPLGRLYKTLATYVFHKINAFKAPFGSQWGHMRLNHGTKMRGGLSG